MLESKGGSKYKHLDQAVINMTGQWMTIFTGKDTQSLPMKKKLTEIFLWFGSVYGDPKSSDSRHLKRL